MYKLTDINDEIIVEGEIVIITDNYISIDDTNIGVSSFNNIKLYKDNVLIDILGYKNNEDSDFSKWGVTQRKAFKLIVKQINVLRELNGLPAFTNQQVINALKNES